MKIETFLKFSVITTLLLISHSLISQTQGQIFDPFTGVGSVLGLEIELLSPSSLPEEISSLSLPQNDVATLMYLAAQA